MDQSVQTLPGAATGGSVIAERNRVLRNTYWLLALSMVPTVLGAWIGPVLRCQKYLLRCF